MKKNRKTTVKNNIFKIITVMLCIAVFVISFADNSYIPSWNDIFKYFKISPESTSQSDFVRVLDVGQGDSILIKSNGYSAIIDTGLSAAANDITENVKSSGIVSLDVVIISHLHMDHVGGLPYISKNINIKNLIIPDLLDSGEGLPAAKEAKQIVIQSKGGVYTAAQGMFFNIGRFKITILAYYPDMKEENNKSIIAIAENKGKKFLFMGDAEKKEENALLNEGLNLNCDVLKVGHHGSSTSTQTNLLKATTPKYAAISVGKGNMYSHPHKETLENLKSFGVKVYRTDQNGDISFYLDKNNINVETEK